MENGNKKIRLPLALILLPAIMLATMFAAVGCNDSPIKWKPTEAQKMAADLTVRDLRSLTPYVEHAADGLLVEATKAAEVTQTYLGLPAKRTQSGVAANVAMIAAAEADANRPDPTPAQVGDSILDQVERGITTGSDIADRLLTVAAGVAGAWGFGRVKKKIDTTRLALTDAEGRAEITLTALRQVVRGVDDYKAAAAPAEKDALKKQFAISQDAETRKIVAVVKTDGVVG